MGHLKDKNIFCLLETCAFIPKISHTTLNFEFFACSQHSMLVKHGFSQPNIALMSVEKLLRFWLKWVICMCNITFC